MAVMQLLLLSLPQPHLQVNNHSHPYQNAVLYALAPNRLQRKELQVLCECNPSHKGPPPGAYQKTTEYTRLGIAL